MAEWYWRRNPAEKVGPRSTEEVRAALVAGLLDPGHEVWREGWDSWARIGDVEEFRGVGPAPAAVAHALPVPEGLRGWMTFVGVMNLLGGLFSILSCFGLLQGILLLVMGFAAIGASSALDTRGGTAPPNAALFLGKLKTYFVAQGLAFIVGFVMTAVFFVLWALGAFGMFVAALGH